MESNKLGDAIIKLPFWIMAYLGEGLLRGFVIKSLWAWYVVPLGLAAIGTIHAIGLAITVSLLLGLGLICSYIRLNSTAAEPSAVVVLVTSVVLTLMAWGAGALWHLFM